MHAARHEAGLTLIEVLVTTVLLALVAAALLGQTNGEVHDRARLRALSRELRDIDARARLIAKSGTRVFLSHEAERGVMTLSERGDRGHRTPLVARPLDEGARCVLLVDRLRPAHEVSFDPPGTSRDYSLELSIGDRRTRLDVSGLTGWVSEAEPSP